MKQRIQTGLTIIVVVLSVFAAATAHAQSPIPAPTATLIPLGNTISHNTPGSFLVFPKFDIRRERVTRIRIANHSASPVSAKLNYVCPGEKHVNEFCSALDRLVTFTPYQTRIIDVDNHNPPCEQGYVVAFPVTEVDHRPISFPHLYGSYHLIDGRRHEANNAISFSGLYYVANPVPEEVLEVEQVFKPLFPGGEFPIQLNLKKNLKTDFQSTLAGGIIGSRLVLLDLNIHAGMQNPPSVAFIDFWNSAEEPFSTSHEFICWSEIQLDEIDDNFRGENLGTEFGSMNIEPRATCPIPGTCPPNLPHQPGMLGTIEQFCEGTRATRTLHNDMTPYPVTYYPR